MLRGSHRYLLAAAILLHASVRPACALVLDWSSLGWTAGSLSNSYNIDSGATGNDITVAVSGDTGELTTDPVNGIATPVINTDQAGGQTPASPGLNLAFDSGKQDRVLTVTVTFSVQYTMGVSGVSLTLAGIDRPGAGNNYIDQIRLISATGIDGVTQIAPVISSLGASVSLSGTGVSQVLTGTNSVPRTGAGSGDGNATITFNSPIRSFTFSFGDDSPSFNNPDPQDFSLFNISFIPVPEPAPGIVASVVAGGAAIIAARRRVQRAAAVANAQPNDQQEKSARGLRARRPPRAPREAFCLLRLR